MRAEDYTIIDKYLDNKLSPPERDEFRKRLETDREFASEVELQRRMRQYLRRKEDRQEMDLRLQQFDERYFAAADQETPRIPIYRRRGFLVAAGLALVVAVALLVMLYLPQPSLYQQYAQHPSLSLTEMSDSGPDLTQTENAFNTGDYAAADRGLEAYLQQNPTDTMALLYQGISLLELGQYEEASVRFSAISAGNSDFRHLAAWYFALTYLRQDQREQARDVLTSIPSGADKYPEAQELLRKLE